MAQEPGQLGDEERLTPDEYLAHPEYGNRWGIPAANIAALPTQDSLDWGYGRRQAADTEALLERLRLLDAQRAAQSDVESGSETISYVQMRILIIGAGLAGLTCAHLLDRAGYDVRVLEGQSRVGGRVQSDTLDGFTLDRGFQVVFEAYPAVQRHIDLDRLDLRRFDPGALICLNGQRAPLTDPIYDSDRLAVLQAATTSIVPFADKLRVIRLTRELRNQPTEELDNLGSLSTLEFLQLRGLSPAIIDRFFRPFFGGVFLDRSLQTNAARFAFYFKMLCIGYACLPAQGMGALSRSLAARLLERERITFNCRVSTLEYTGEQVSGVRTEDGTLIEADIVVLAIPAPEARRLSGDTALPQTFRRTTTLYWRSPEPVVQGKKIALNAAPDAFINNLQQISTVAPEYAPAGQHLLSASILDIPDLDDDALWQKALLDMRRMFAGDQQAQAALDTVTPLRAYRIAEAQFDQPTDQLLPSNQARQDNLFYAAEFTEGSSINGAVLSGEKCARLLHRRYGLEQRDLGSVHSVGLT